MAPYQTRPQTNSKCNGKLKMKHEVANNSNGLQAINNMPYERKIKWLNLSAISILHVVALWSIIRYLTKLHPLSYAWSIIMLSITAFGVTGGAHRYWTHRSYKAKLPLKIILLFSYATSGQNPLYDWVRDHRVHHKFSETDADPHNSKRGFFFSHVGWLLQTKHPDVIQKGQIIDMSDITSDRLIMLYSKYFWLMKGLMTYIFPWIIPVYFWDEKWQYAILFHLFVHLAITLNATWSVNSFAHMWGTRPYDKPVSIVRSLSMLKFLKKLKITDKNRKF